MKRQRLRNQANQGGSDTPLSAYASLATAVLFAGAAALLIQSDAVDTLRAALAAKQLQLDEVFFIMIAGGLGASLASGLAHRRTRLSLNDWAAERCRSEDLACRDPLTGLFNRRGLDMIASRAPAAGRTRQLLLVDLDDFKGVNDTHGHRTGDDVLRAFADRVAAADGPLREVAGVRLGGDEFVLVISGDADTVSEAVTRQITGALETAGPNAEPVWVTMSAGLTPWPADMSLKVALDQADVAMYEAKRVGTRLCRFDHLSDELGSSPARLRRLFERELSGLEHSAAPIWVAALSLDRYYTAKRALGHGYAAQMVRGLREVLEEQQPGLLIERIAPDALAVLFAAETSSQANIVVETLTALCLRLQAPDGSVVAEQLTIGLAGPASAACVRETVEQAQVALDDARRSGRKQVLFDRVERDRADGNVRLMDDLRHAIATDGLEVHYQPKMTSRSGEIDSFEALVRWDHPLHGAISPGMFVPIAEACGEVEGLTYWVIERALRDWLRLDALGIARPIYVNISAQLIGVPAFADRLLSMLDGADGRIGIEITETAVLDNPTLALRHLRQIAAAGISIAIDDYGVGLSSLSYLKQLPATELKIDMSFITHLADSHRDPMIVRSTIDLAHGLGLRVTAEGVDKPEVLSLLKIMGCDMIQGYQISAAVPVDHLILFMRDHDTSLDHVPECAAQLLKLISI